MRLLLSALFASVFATATAQTCNTTTLQSTVPVTGNVVLKSFSYCSGYLNATAYVANLDYNKVVTLYYSDVQGQSTPLSTADFNYVSSVDGSNYELWTTSAPAWINGIQKLLNITFVASDLGETYTQQLNVAITASGGPVPTLPAPPEPYATPSGFGDDITTWLAAKNGSQTSASLAKMFVNVNPAIEGAVKGVVVAGRSGPSFESKLPDYEYDWVRDSSLTMDVVQSLYAATTNPRAKAQYENALFAYSTGRATEQNDPNLLTGLGEPKFYLNNTIFSGPWGRPQNDGPATAAITLMEFAASYLKAGGNTTAVLERIYDSTNYPSTAPVKKDLLFVASNWTYPSFDLWEEESSKQFYTRMVQRRALIMGATFAKQFNDTTTASTLQNAANALTATLPEFWDQGRQILLYEYGPVLRGKTSYLDTAVPLGLIHGYAGDGVYSWTNDKVQSTIVRLVTSFIDVYPIANRTQKDSSGQPIGIPIGRYPEDVYNGTGTETNGGNPWYLTTAAIAQYMYATSAEYAASGTIAPTNTSKAFFDYFAPTAGVKVGQTYASGSKEFASVIASLHGWGDAFMRTIKYYTPTDQTLTEEFNRNTGTPQGCQDLTWSYASVLTAALQRAQTKNDTNYATSLANGGFVENT